MCPATVPVRRRGEIEFPAGEGYAGLGQYVTQINRAGSHIQFQSERRVCVSNRIRVRPKFVLRNNLVLAASNFQIRVACEHRSIPSVAAQK